MSEVEPKAEKKFYKKWWFWALAVIVFIMVVANSGDSTSTPGQTATNQEAQQPAVAIKVTAEALRQAYKTNQVSADQQYEDKLVEISGTVDTIGKDVLDEAYITFQPKDPYAFDKVQCMFSSTEEGSIANLRKGQSVVVQGKVSGSMITSVIVRNCKLISS